MELSPVSGETTDAASGSLESPANGTRKGQSADAVRCRTNSRHGLTDLSRRSYPPVESVCRALEILNVVNKLRIASINGIYEETKFPKSTIVRMLETLMSEGYVARDNMCGGYRVTSRVGELSAGYEGISRIIEVARPLAINLTRRTKWPVGIGVIDGDEIAIQFWTGAISPWDTDSILGLRTDMEHSAMGRVYLAFCSEAERERHLALLRADPARDFDESAERRLRLLLEQVRTDGYALRDPRTWPYRRTTFAMPIREGETVHAMISTSYFTTAIPKHKLAEQIIEPLRCTTTKIEEAFAFMNAGIEGNDLVVDPAEEDLEFGF